MWINNACAYAHTIVVDELFDVPQDLPPVRRQQLLSILSYNVIPISGLDLENTHKVIDLVDKDVDPTAALMLNASRKRIQANAVLEPDDTARNLASPVGLDPAMKHLAAIKKVRLHFCFPVETAYRHPDQPRLKAELPVAAGVDSLTPF